MKLHLKKIHIVFIIIFGVLLIDQTLKVWIKTHMSFSDTYYIFGHWFLIKFIENPGMAFGIDIPGNLGKPLLTIFRIVAVIGIGWYINKLIKTQSPTGIIACIALIMAGAIGNIIDSVFYGMIFSETTYTQVANAFPQGGGYASLLHGKVVDMLYFPIIRGFYPSWFPILGGQSFEFFRPVFNLADTSISVGVLSILLFQRKHLKEI